MLLSSRGRLLADLLALSFVAAASLVVTGATPALAACQGSTVHDAVGGNEKSVASATEQTFS